MAISRPSGTYDVDYAHDMAIVRTRFQWVVLIVGLVLLFSLPLFIGGHILYLVNFMALTVIAVQGLSILTGFTGLISLGQASFMAVGAYTSCVLTTRFGFSFWAALPCAAIMASVIGLVFGLPSLRIKGFYLALSTLAAQYIITTAIMYPLAGITGGVHAIRAPVPMIGSFAFDSQEKMFYIIMPLAALVTFLAKNLVRSGVGRAFIAIRDNDLAAEVMGINIFRYKVTSFAISSFFAGIAGCLYAHWIGSALYLHYDLMHSLWLIGMVIVGGMGYTTGAVFGTIFIRGLDEVVRTTAVPIGALIGLPGGSASAVFGPIAFGGVIILFLVYEPRGLAHAWEILKSYIRLFPFTR
jgi:branched-chain amino acid transport system permease protein